MFTIIFPIYLFFGFLYSILLIFCVWSVYAIFKGAPFVPTNKTNVKKMLDIANLQPTDILLDLGSGDGRIIFSAAPHVKQAIGIEINPTLYWYSKIRHKINGNQNIKIMRKNLWEVNLSQVDVLTLFFIAGKMEKLGKKIIAEMKPGSRVVSNAFSFPGWSATKTDGQIKMYLLGNTTHVC